MQAEFLLKTEKSSDLTVTEIKNRSYRLHFHSNIELILVLDGELEVWINNRRKLLRKGEISVAWSYDAHGYATPLHSVSLSVIIPPRYYSEFLPLFNNRHTNDPFLSDPLLFEQIHSWARSPFAIRNTTLQSSTIISSRVPRAIGSKIWIPTWTSI